MGCLLYGHVPIFSLFSLFPLLSLLPLRINLPSLSLQSRLALQSEELQTRATSLRGVGLAR
jgi:hypothetical protein